MTKKKIYNFICNKLDNVSEYMNITQKVLLFLNAIVIHTQNCFFFLIIILIFFIYKKLSRNS